MTVRISDSGCCCFWRFFSKGKVGSPFADIAKSTPGTLHQRSVQAVGLQNKPRLLGPAHITRNVWFRVFHSACGLWRPIAPIPQNNWRNWPRLTRGKPARSQMRTQRPPNPPRSHLQFRTIHHFSTFPFFFLPCELLGRATGVIERSVPLRKHRSKANLQRCDGVCRDQHDFFRRVKQRLFKVQNR